MKGRYKDKLNVKVIPNAIRQIERTSYTNRKKSILYVGRLSWEKGVDRLIKAFSLLENTDWKLEIVGNGPLAQEYKKMAFDLGINNKVIFHGHWNRTGDWRGAINRHHYWHYWLVPDHIFLQ